MLVDLEEFPKNIENRNNIRVLNFVIVGKGGSIVDKIEERLIQTDKRRKFLTSLFVIFILISTILYFFKLPANMAGWFVPFKVETATYIPISVENQYSKLIGFKRVKTVYENSNETITVWATSEIGWNNVSNWDEHISLSDNTTAYYNSRDRVQMISWRKGNVEYAIDFKGAEPLSKYELIKIASSLK
jgi:hypothetical protein